MLLRIQVESIATSYTNLLTGPIDGLELDTLQPNVAFTTTDRDVTLSGLLADGEQFSFNLNSVATRDNVDSFSPDATLNVKLVPIILGDINRDEEVNFLDIAPFIEVLATPGGFQGEADIDQNDVVNFLDIALLAALLAGG